MRITWLVSSAVTHKDGQWYSPLASLRYRVLSPARYLESRGHRSQFQRLDQRPDNQQIDHTLRADVVVVSKILAAGSIELAERAQRLGARVVVDLCDDHFDTPDLAPAYRTLCERADRVIASTSAMAEVIASRTGRRATIIDDPYEGPLGVPRFEPQADATRLLWFGHPVNFDTIVDMGPKLAALARANDGQLLSLHVVTDPTNNGFRAFLDELNRDHAPRLTARFTVWNPEATWQALAECDIVVVPSLPSAKKLVKSPNRVVEPLRAGRFVAAYPLPSYVELGDYIWLGPNVADGVRWALKNPAEVRRRLTAAQSHLDRRYSPLATGRAWEAALLQTVECERCAA
jgi:hypothetical protein